MFFDKLRAKTTNHHPALQVQTQTLPNCQPISTPHYTCFWGFVEHMKNNQLYASLFVWTVFPYLLERQLLNMHINHSQKSVVLKLLAIFHCTQWEYFLLFTSQRVCQTDCFPSRISWVQTLCEWRASGWYRPFHCCHPGLLW